MLHQGLSDRELSACPVATKTLAQTGTLSAVWSVRSSIGTEPPRRVMKIEASASRLLWPAWTRTTVDNLLGLLDLRPNWDSYGAHPISTTSVETAVSLLLQVMQDHSVPPAVVPTSSGGVQLEWHLRGIDLEAEVSPSGAVYAYEHDHQSGAEWEGELPAELERFRQTVEGIST